LQHEATAPNNLNADLSRFKYLETKKAPSIGNMLLVTIWIYLPFPTFPFLGTNNYLPSMTNNKYFPMFSDYLKKADDDDNDRKPAAKKKAYPSGPTPKTTTIPPTTPPCGSATTTLKFHQSPTSRSYQTTCPRTFTNS
jgi:hypothetical protein